jgi:hypothetical protein
MISVVGSAAPHVIGYSKGDPHAWAGLRSALLASGILLALYALIHLVRTPWLVHQDVSSKAKPVGMRYGVIGGLVILGLFGGIVATLVFVVQIVRVNAVRQSAANDRRLGESPKLHLDIQMVGTALGFGALQLPENGDTTLVIASAQLQDLGEPTAIKEVTVDVQIDGQILHGTQIDILPAMKFNQLHLTGADYWTNSVALTPIQRNASADTWILATFHGLNFHEPFDKHAILIMKCEGVNGAQAEDRKVFGTGLRVPQKDYEAGTKRSGEPRARAAVEIGPNAGRNEFGLLAICGAKGPALAVDGSDNKFQDVKVLDNCTTVPAPQLKPPSVSYTPKSVPQ